MRNRWAADAFVHMRRIAAWLRTELLCWTGCFWWAKFRLRREGAVVVLMLHRVLTREEYEKTGSEPDIILGVETFRNLVRYAKRTCEIAALETPAKANDAGSQTARASRTRPMIAITLDDGWHDNYTSVLPVVIAEGIPVTIFVCPGLIGCDLPFWPEQIAKAMKKKAPELRQSELTALVEQLKDFEPQRRDLLIGALSRQNGAPSCREVKEIDRTLSWEEILEMSKAGVRFGSHSCSHQILPQLPLDEVQHEIRDSKQALDLVLNSECKVFAYPNGNYSKSARRILAEAGYQAAVTTECGAWTRDRDPFAIPRVNISDSSVTGLSGRFSGAMFDYTVFWRAYRRLGSRRKMAAAWRSVTP